MDSDPRDSDSRDDERFGGHRDRADRDSSDALDRDDDWRQPAASRDRDDDVRTLGRGVGDSRSSHSDENTREEARRFGLDVLGTLRVLADAAEHDVADLAAAFDRLKRTNFRASDELMQRLLEHHAKRRGRR